MARRKQKKRYYVHESYPSGPYVTTSYASKSAAQKAARSARREGGKARVQLAGFGLTKPEHQHRAGMAGREARINLRRTRQYLAVGDCVRAVHSLVAAAESSTELRVHANSRSLRIGKRKKSGRGGHSHTSMDAVDKLTNRVIDACVKGGRY